jgi:hypothetical protein
VGAGWVFGTCGVLAGAEAVVGAAAWTGADGVDGASGACDGSCAAGVSCAVSGVFPPLNRLKKLNMVCRDECRGEAPAAAMDGAWLRMRRGGPTMRQCA